MNHLNIQKTAILLSLVLLIACIISFVIITIRYQDTSGGYTAYIYQNGSLYRTIDLDSVSEEYSITLFTDDNHYNQILVSPGAVSISEADCPDQICVKQGKIFNSLLPITCLPNRIVIELHPTSHSEESMPDAITH